MRRRKLSTSVLAVFCEDIREEKSGQDTLVGIFSDNLAVSSVPGVMPKLCVYLRGFFPVSQPPTIFGLRLELPNGEEPLALGSMDANAIAEVAKVSETQGNDVVGLILKAVLSPFPIRDVGRLRAVASIGSNELVAVSLNIMLPPSEGAAPSPTLQSKTRHVLVDLTDRPKATRKKPRR